MNSAEAPIKRNKNHPNRASGRKPKLLRPYRLLRIELGRMRRLYDACIYSFAVAGGELDSGLKSQQMSAATKIVAPGTERVLAWSPIEMLERMKDTYPEMLRASLLVRAVSHMENYFVDLLNEVAKRSLPPFKQQDKMVSFSQAQLLSFDSTESLRAHLLEAECRALNGKGFREFEKYYKRRFNIAFSQGPISVDDVEGIYARRHLLVHAGGVVDQQFQRRFAPHAHPGDVLQISEDYFFEALQKLADLAQYCAVRIEALFPSDVASIPPPITNFTEQFSKELFRLVAGVAPEATVLATWFDAVFRTPQLLEAHFADGASFNVEKQPHLLSAILAGKKQTGERSVQWLVCGEKTVVGPYIAYLEFLSRRGLLEEFDKHNVAIRPAAREQFPAMEEDK